MASIKGLGDNDLVEVNGEKYKVIRKKSYFYELSGKILNMILELTKITGKNRHFHYCLSYIHDRPDKLKFFRYNLASKEIDDIEIASTSLKII